MYAMIVKIIRKTFYCTIFYNISRKVWIRYVCELEEINVSTKLSLPAMSFGNKRILFFFGVSHGKHVAEFRNHWFIHRTGSRGCEPGNLPLKSWSGAPNYQIIKRYINRFYSLCNEYYSTNYNLLWSCIYHFFTHLSFFLESNCYVNITVA